MYARILVPIDGSDCSKVGLQEVIKIYNQQSRAVMLIHVLDMSHWNEAYGPETVASMLMEPQRAAARRLLEEAAGGLRAAGIPVELVLAESHHQRPAELIVEHAHNWHAELIVMGTHGRRGTTRFVLGSNAADVVRTSPAPVLLVRCLTR